jgi:phenylacetate-CoA ligase
MISIPQIEKTSTEEMQAHQVARLRELVKYVQERSPFYKRLLATHEVQPDSITSLDVLAQIQPTTKDDLQKYNWDFLCVPRDQVAEYASTSGTLGRPVTIALTKNDLKRLSYNEFLSFACAGGTSSDVYQLMLTLDRQFMAGIAYYHGIQELGAATIRVGPGVPSMQLDSIERLKPTTLVVVPSFLVKLIDFAESRGFDLNSTSVKAAVCIGESIRTNGFEKNVINRKITERWDIQLFSTYAATEMQTAFTECSYQNGGHHHPELLILEVLDESGVAVKNGEAGEITVTTLGVEGMPLLRYRTGDIAHVYTEPCKCGRTTMRLGPVIGRKQQLIKVKGTTIYPPGLFEILNEARYVQDYCIEVFQGDLETDELRVHVLSSENEPETVIKDLGHIFQSRLRVLPEIRLATAQELEALQLGPGERKIKRFIDRRAKSVPPDGL